MTMLPVVWWWLNQAATMSLFKGVLLARVSGELATANCTLLPKCQEKESKARGRELMNVSACFLLLNREQWVKNRWKATCLSWSIFKGLLLG